MGLFDNVRGTQQTVLPEVAECERQLVQLQEKKREAIYQIGMRFVSSTGEKDVISKLYEESMTELNQIAVEMEYTERRKLAVQGLRKCEKCSNVLVLESAFCNKCGAKLEPISSNVFTQQEAGKKCPSCGASCDDDASFCVSCGTKLG